jgi:predicted HTH domain antitoxin
MTEMQVTVEIPDSIGAQLKLNVWTLSRELLQAFAIEGYRMEKLSRGQVSQLLDLNFWKSEVFLSRHRTLLHYDLSDLEQDRQALHRRL